MHLLVVFLPLTGSLECSFSEKTLRGWTGEGPRESLPTPFESDIVFRSFEKDF